MEGKAQYIRDDLVTITSILMTYMLPKGIYNLLAEKYDVSRERIRQCAEKVGCSIIGKPLSNCEVCGELVPSKGSKRCMKHKYLWIRKSKYDFSKHKIYKLFGSPFHFITVRDVMKVNCSTTCHLLTIWIHKGYIKHTEKKGIYRIVWD
jgi:hypothetical protein